MNNKVCKSCVCADINEQPDPVTGCCTSGCLDTPFKPDENSSVTMARANISAHADGHHQPPVQGKRMSLEVAMDLEKRDSMANTVVSQNESQLRPRPTY